MEKLHILKYKKNCCYIEDVSDIFVGADEILFSEEDVADITSSLTANTFSDEKAFKRAISLGHEVNHYMQELSINACITSGFFRDYLTAYAKILSNNSAIKFPLNNIDNYEYNHNSTLCDSYQRVLTTMDNMQDVYRFIFLKKHRKPKTKEYLYNSPNEKLFIEKEICYDDLLESYAFYKSYWDFFYFNQEGESAKILKKILHDTNFCPIKFKDGQYVIENLKQTFEYVYPYQIVHFLIVVGLPYDTSMKNYLEYCDKEMPFNYQKSPASIVHSAMKVILETALYIPSFDFIMDSLQKNIYDADVFSPVHRFYKIIKTIRDNGGYPDSINGEDYFETFFKFVASKNHWPSYEETFNSMCTMLAQRAKEGKEAIINYQLAAILNKKSEFCRFMQYTPYVFLKKLCLPLIVNNHKGLSVNYYFSNGIDIDLSGRTDFFTRYFCKTPIKKYEFVYSALSEQEAMERVINNSDAAIREIIHRLFSNASYSAYYNKGKYECPFYNIGCPYSKKECRCFTSFDSATQNCKQRILRLPELQTILDKEEGNFPDCMFLNFLLDNDYNILK